MSARRHRLPRVARIVAIAVAVICIPSACKKKSDVPPGATPAAPPTTPAGGPATSTELPGPISARPRLLRASDLEGIRHYLQTVDTVTGATFDVTWAPGAVRLDRATTLRAFRGISEDGGTIRFDGGEPALAAITPGAPLLVWGIALRKVTSTAHAGDTLIVQTDPIALPDAITSGTIDWQVDALPTQQAIVTKLTSAVVSAVTGQPGASAAPPAPASPAPASPPGGTGFAPPRPGIRVRTVAWHRDRHDAQDATPAPGATGGDNAPGAGPAGGGLPTAPETEPPEETPEHEFEGILGFYVYKLGFASVKKGMVDVTVDIYRTDESQEAGTKKERNGEKLEKTIEGTKKQIAGEGEGPSGGAGSVYEAMKPSDLLDLRVNARAHINSGVSSGHIRIAGAGKTAANFVNSLSGYLNLSLTARVGTTPQFLEKFKLMLPVSFNTPLLIGGIPFMASFGANLIVRPALTSKYASATGQYYASFNGTEGVTVGAGNVAGDGSITDDSSIQGGDFTGVGISALQVSLQLPKLGLGIGLWNTGVMAYVDQVFTGSQVYEGAGGIALVPCKEWSINAVWSAGGVAQFFGFVMKDVKKPIWTLTPPIHRSMPEGLKCTALQ